MATRHIIFDWDGTLMDSTPRIVAAMQATARSLELTVPEDDAVKHIIGLSLPRAYQDLFPGAPSEHYESFFNEYRFQYLEGCAVPSPMFEGAEQVLHSCINQGYNLAIATGKARIGLDRVLQESALAHYFVDSICADEAEGKPHPDMLLQLLQRNNWLAEQCIMVGDTAHDIKMAQAAGITAIGVSYGAHTLENIVAHEPDSILHDIRELTDYLANRMTQSSI
ncbi:MAG: HAD-IA family hydrolase [Gammaproteobacteria bacterium]|nr:HAD-IA family hydrolase [Gammaproteobacteria bacterium]